MSSGSSRAAIVGLMVAVLAVPTAARAALTERWVVEGASATLEDQRLGEFCLLDAGEVDDLLDGVPVVARIAEIRQRSPIGHRVHLVSTSRRGGERC